MAVKLNQGICFVLFRFLLPIVLIACTIFRFSGFSLLYGCMALINPLIYRPTHQSLRQHCGRYLFALVALTTLTLLAQTSFQIYMSVTGSNKDPTSGPLANCTELEQLLRQIGLQRIEPDDSMNVARIILPDAVAFLTSVLIFAACKALLASPAEGTNQRSSSPGGGSRPRSMVGSPQPSGVPPGTPRLFRLGVLLSDYLGTFMVVLMMGLCGVAMPSVLTGVYFICFLVVGTLWACCVRVRGAWFVCIERLMLLYSALHLIAIYITQFQFMAELWEDTQGNSSMVERILGLPRLVEVDCTAPWLVHILPHVKWPVYLCVAFILVFYFVLAIEVRRKQDKQYEGAGAESAQLQVSTDELAGEAGSGARPTSPRRSPRSSSLLPTRRRVHSLLHDVENSERQGLIDDDGSIHNYNTLDGAGQEEEPRRPRDGPKGVGRVIYKFILQQSYIFCLIVMMAWSIAYHSWLTFVLLLAACLIWIIPQKRFICLAASPAIVFYAECLLIIDYVYGFNLTDSELPPSLPSGYNLEEIGLIKYDYPIIPLVIKGFFTFIFWMTLRQFVQECSARRRAQRLEASSLETLDGDDLESGQKGRGADGVKRLKVLTSFLWDCLCKYWIFACGGLFLLIALQEAVAFRIIYMILFLYFVISFQLSYTFWRFSVKAFWTIVILYSMVVLITLYVFQFNDIVERWRNVTGMSQQLMEDIGLEKYDRGQLFVQLLTPTSFLIFIILHLHYFQATFLRLSDINRFRNAAAEESERTAAAAAAAVDIEPTCRESAASADRPVDSSVALRPKGKRRWLGRLPRCIAELYNSFTVLLWRYLEVHIHKLVLLAIFLLGVNEVSAMNVVLIILVVVLLPVTTLQRCVSVVSLLYCSAVVLAKIIYQLKVVQPEKYFYSNCTEMRGHNVSRDDIPYPFNETIDNPQYLGLQKTDNLSKYLQNYVLVILLLGLEAVVRVHQRQHFNDPRSKKPATGIIFYGVHRAQADLGLIKCGQFFFNYGFYKFGKEVCFIMTVITMVVRLDLYSVIYGVFLGFLVIMRRRSCYRVWPLYIIVLTVLLVLQYLSCLGVPLALCWEYPWRWNPNMFPNLNKFLFLPSHLSEQRPACHKLIADFFQLLFVCLQWRVFSEEFRDTAEQRGGYNRSIVLQLDAKLPNPTRDFIHYTESYLDYVKRIVFHYSYWVTLLVLFIAATTRTSLFCMGYLCGCFVFLWFGHKVLIMPLRRLLKMWYFLIMYCYFVLMAKCCLQLVGCVPPYVASLPCVVVKLFAVVCIQENDNYLPVDDNYKCKMEQDAQGLSWDAISFVFLIMMLRVYKTWYFQHVVADLSIDNELEARGSHLINSRLIERVEAEKKIESITLQKIRDKMEIIRQRQHRLNPESADQRLDHFTVIRSGDYYMFDDIADDGFDHLTEYSDDSQEAGEKPGPLQLLNEGLRKGTQDAIDMWRHSSMSEEGSSPQATAELSLGADEEEEDIDENLFGKDADGKRTKTSTPSRSKSEREAEAGEEADIRAVSLRAEEQRKELESSVEKKEKDSESLCKKISNLLHLAYLVICSSMERLIVFLNQLSKDYREVSEILEEEKLQRLAEKECGMTVLEQQQTFVEPIESAQDVETAAIVRPRDVHVTVDDGQRCVEGSRRSRHENQQKEQKFQRKMPLLLRLVIAALQVAFSRSELLCYFFMVLNVLMLASLPSLVYPITAFIWAMMCVPRPMKIYWVSIITYTEVLIVIKYLFQFAIFPWNDPKNPNYDSYSKEAMFYPVFLFGLEKKDQYAVFDLLLLFSLFIHRTILTQHGLWKDADDLVVSSTSEDNATTDTTISPTDSKRRGIESNGSDVPVSQTDEGGAIVSVEGGARDDEQDIVPEAQSIRRKSTKGVWMPMVRARSRGKRSAEPIESTSTVPPPVDDIPHLCMPADVYSWMFVCDLIAFVITVFGFSSFGPSDEVAGGGATVASVLKQNKIPASFLIMLLVQFLLIIVDRAVYLRKNVFGKIVFQIFLVVLVHVWMFFALPQITQKRFPDNVAAQLWYFTKCIYFALSSYQIRCCYPTRILGNFLTKNYNYINLIGFKGFVAIPFLLELRALMDWMFTDTTLALTSWLQMEDIFANVFPIKCARRAEKAYPTPRGIKRAALIKYGLGGVLLGLLIFIIWFPLLLFSMSSAIYIPNPPIDISVSIKFWGYQPIFTMSAQQQLITNFTQSDYNNLRNQLDKRGKAFLNLYNPNDIRHGVIIGTSGATWDITPPDIDRLADDLRSNNTDMNLYFQITFSREPTPSSPSESVSDSFLRTLKFSDKEDNKAMNKLANMISRPDADESVVIRNLYPNYWTVPANGKPRPSEELYFSNASASIYSNVTLKLNRYPNNTYIKWWTLSDGSKLMFRPHTYNMAITAADDHALHVVTFNERIAPEGVLAMLNKYGVIGLYVSMVLVIGGFVRMYVQGLSFRIMFLELPNPDVLVKLCLDIYMVRETGELELEEELFAQLMFLYRSPETLIKVTKHKVD